MPSPVILEDYNTRDYSGILQLRCLNHERLDKVMAYVRQAGGVCKVELAKYGYDVFIGPHAVMNRLSRQLPKQFGGELSLTRQLVTRRRQTSKQVFRLCVLFWIFPYSPGDILVVEGSPVKITGTGLRITGNNLANGKRTSFSYRKGMKLEKLEVQMAEVSQYRPTLKLIHPENFQPVEPSNKVGIRKRHYSVVVLGKSLYVLC